MSKDTRAGRRVGHKSGRHGFVARAAAPTQRGGGEHKEAELTLAQQARLLTLLESNPQEFMQQVALWRAQNPGDTMRLASENAPSILTNVDLTPYEGFDLKDVSFAGVLFRRPQFPNEALANAFFGAGAHLSDQIVGAVKQSSRMQPMAKPAPVATTPAERVAEGPLSPRERAQREAAAMTAMIRSGR